MAYFRTRCGGIDASLCVRIGEGLSCRLFRLGGDLPAGAHFTGYDTYVGSRSSCVSDAGAFDLVANLNEWVADWVPRSTSSVPDELFGGTSDFNCLAGADTTLGPGALLRGGFFNSRASAGVFAVRGSVTPSEAIFSIGFRAAR